MSGAADSAVHEGTTFEPTAEGALVCTKYAVYMLVQGAGPGEASGFAASGT